MSSTAHDLAQEFDVTASELDDDFEVENITDPQGDDVEPQAPGETGVARISPSAPLENLDLPPRVLVRYPEVPEPYHFDLLQQWEGTVVDLREDEFEAQLSDLTDPSLADEVAVFSKDEVSRSDLPLLELGAVFRWNIGYRTQNGQKERVSRISFLRLPAWSRSKMEAVEATAQQLRELFLPSEDSP